MSLEQKIVDAYNEEYDNVERFAREVVPYILHGFRSSLEGRELYSLSIQSTSDGGIRSVLRAWDKSKPGRVTGVISYGNFDSIPEALAAIECGLAYDMLSWRDDKFAKVGGDEEKPLPKRKKITIG